MKDAGAGAGAELCSQNDKVRLYRGTVDCDEAQWAAGTNSVARAMSLDRVEFSAEESFTRDWQTTQQKQDSSDRTDSIDAEGLSRQDEEYVSRSRGETVLLASGELSTSELGPAALNQCLQKSK